MRALILAVVVAATVALAASVTVATHTGSTSTPSGGAAGIVVSPTSQATLSVQVVGDAITSASLVGWCYTSGTWGRLPAFDVDLSLGGPRVAGRPAESPGFLTSGPLNIPPSCTRLYWQTIDIRPSGLSHTVQVSLASSASSSSSCSSIVQRVISCGTTPLTVPSSRTAGSTSLEIANSPENAGSPKVKCIADPSDGGVGFGSTNPGSVRSPGESMYFGLDTTHTVICACDTPATAVSTSECVP